MDSQYQVTREENFIKLSDMSHPSVVGNFMRRVYDGRKKGYQDFILDFSDVDAAFPNVCTPISGLLNYYSNQEKIDFLIQGVSDFLAKTNFIKPLPISNKNLNIQSSVMNTVWQFENSTEIGLLHKKYIQEVSRAAECEEGVIPALEWSLYEVMDNVLQHSQVCCGYIMGQIHISSKYIAFCIYDYGEGIFNSLRYTHYSPKNAVDAITLAIKEGVTRDSSNGQGNGLWGLHNMVKSNSGRLNITSGCGFYGLQGDEIKTSNKVPYLSKDKNCTTIDFQISFDHPIAFSESLGGFEPANLRIEALEDEQQNIRYRLADQATGTGTRQSGSALRNEIINLSRESKSLIVIDFENISVVSSSFADELIGKLIATYGFTTFVQMFKLVNMNPFVRSIVDRSVAQRMGELYKPK